MHSQTHIYKRRHTRKYMHLTSVLAKYTHFDKCSRQVQRKIDSDQLSVRFMNVIPLLGFFGERGFGWWWRSAFYRSLQNVLHRNLLSHYVCLLSCQGNLSNFRHELPRDQWQSGYKGKQYPVLWRRSQQQGRTIHTGHVSERELSFLIGRANTEVVKSTALPL